MGNLINVGGFGRGGWLGVLIYVEDTMYFVVFVVFRGLRGGDIACVVGILFI